MDIISIIVVLVVVGFLLWLINVLIPMPAPWPRVISGIVCFVAFLWILQALGIWHGAGLRLR
jgi:hypothetical protein